MKKNAKNQFPKISIVTPSFNQGEFIEQTIRSVLSQKYPDLEYVVIDGGSTDATLSILKKYQRSLLFISEPDTGQSDAINKGLNMVSGDIVGIINSDDFFEPDCFRSVAGYFTSNPDAQWVTGACRIVNESGKEVRKTVTGYKNFFLRYFRRFDIFCVVQFISQPSTFWRKRIIREIGTFDVSLKYDMDYDYWLRIWKKYPLYFIDSFLSSYRVHSRSKAVTSPETQFHVEHQILTRHTRSSVILFLHFLHVRIALCIYRALWIKKLIPRKLPDGI